MATEPAPVPAARVVFDEADRAEILGLVDAALVTGNLTLGPTTRAFEALFAEQHRAPHAIAVSSGTAALEIVLRAVGVAGRDVVIPTNTFAATAYAVQAAGARPVLADIDADTLALSPQTVEAAFTPATAAVVTVHIGGLISPQTPALAQLCRARGITLVEDAAHAHGCTLDGQHAGSFGVAGSFSFYPTKVLTSGEGGMIVTADERIRDEAMIHRDQGKAGFHDGRHVRFGYAWRMSEVHAAIGLVHARRLAQFITARRRIAERYTAALAGLDGLTPLPLPPGVVSNVYKYVAVLDDDLDRDLITARAAESGVRLSGPVYSLPLHRQPVFAELADRALPVAERVCAQHVCLPVHSDMTDDEADRVVAAVTAAVAATRTGR